MPASEGFSLFQKAAFFAVILALVGVYLRVSRSGNERDVGYEKTMA